MGGAGAFVWHEDAVDPATLRGPSRCGFLLAAIRLHQGVDVDPVEAGWTRGTAPRRPLGGWGVLHLAAPGGGVAVALLRRLRLGFYVANPEEEYKYDEPRRHECRPLGALLEFARSFCEFTGAVPAAVRPTRAHARTRLEGLGRSRLRVLPRPT